MTFVSDLDPTLLWGHFDAILEIPRGDLAKVVWIVERGQFRLGHCLQSAERN